jgi:hypothetical protein
VLSRCTARRGHDGGIVCFDVRDWNESAFGSPGPSEWDCESWKSRNRVKEPPRVGRNEALYFIGQPGLPRFSSPEQCIHGSKPRLLVGDA